MPTLAAAPTSRVPTHQRWSSATMLTLAARAWFATALAGQIIFISYLLAFYWMAALQGNFAAWNKVLPNAHVAGNSWGNAAIAVHVLIAAIVTLGGPLQLFGRRRARCPAFHRWNGRVYLVTVVLASLTGLYLNATRRADNLVQQLGIDINALLILAAAFIAVRHAMHGRTAAHRRWALRLFLLVSGSWFFRVGLMFWIAANGGPAGFDPGTFQGPALIILGFLQWLVPLAVLELYFYARDRGLARARIAASVTLLAATVVTAIGVVVATMAFWWPHIG